MAPCGLSLRKQSTPKSLGMVCSLCVSLSAAVAAPTSNAKTTLERLGPDYSTASQKDAQDRLTQMGKEALPDLIQALLKSDDNRRLRVIEVMGQMQDRRASVYLLKAYELNEAVIVRCKILESLGKMRDPSLLDWYLERLKESDESIRCYALWALGELHSPRAATILEKIIREEKGYVRITAVDALGKCGQGRQVPLLKEFLLYEDAELRYVAAKTLGEIGTADLTDFLLDRMTRDPSIEVQEALAQAAGKTGGAAAASALAQRMIRNDAPIMDHLLALGLEASGVQAIPVVVDLMHRPELRLRIAGIKILSTFRAPEAIPHLIKLLDESDTDIRMSAVAALGDCGTWDTLPALMKAAQSRDRLLRESASEAIRKITKRNEALYQNSSPPGGP